jgi:hypothetical protein
MFSQRGLAPRIRLEFAHLLTFPKHPESRKVGGDSLAPGTVAAN